MKFICEITNKDGQVVDFEPYVDKHVNMYIKQFTHKSNGDRIVVAIIDGTDLRLHVQGTHMSWSVPSYTDAQLDMWNAIEDFLHDRGEPTDLSKEYIKFTVGLGRTKRDTLFVKYVDKVHAEAKESSK